MITPKMYLLSLSGKEILREVHSKLSSGTNLPEG
jgi:hypothetical protein